MINKEEFQSDLNEVFKMLKENMTNSFEHIDKNPDDTKEMITIWKSFANNLMDEFITLSEIYDNREIAKALGKMIMFGR